MDGRWRSVRDSGRSAEFSSMKADGLLPEDTTVGALKCHNKLIEQDRRFKNGARKLCSASSENAQTRRLATISYGVGHRISIAR
jgi:hypothetical protein